MSTGVSFPGRTYRSLAPRKALTVRSGMSIFNDIPALIVLIHSHRLDPSVRVVYHPLRTKISQSGFYSRNRVQTFSQRITIHNTKSTPFSDFKVIDAVPVSESSQITVKLISPALVLPEPPASDAERKQPPPLQVGEGVVAQWEGADEPGFDLEALGRDGKLNWVCSIPSQGKVNLLLSWEVVAPARLTIEGL